VNIILWSQDKAVGPSIVINLQELHTEVPVELILICFAPLCCTFPECKLYSGYWSVPHSAIQACLKCIVVYKLEC
jgi:hypothetical protein